MTLAAGIGQAQALDGREAGLQAAHQALNKVGNVPPILGIVIASHQYEAAQVVNGVVSLTGNLPLVGFSSPASLTRAGLATHAVTVALLAASDARADVQWLSGYSQASREVGRQLEMLLAEHPDRPALLFTDGFNADAGQLCASLPAGAFLAGGLSCGDLHTGNAYQIAGSQSGASGLALARLEGRIRVGVGAAHGWQPVGANFRITRSRGFWLRMLDGRPASETYARLFGYPAREWAFPPLNHLARLYPLGIQQAGDELLLRSPIRVEADGSFRLNAPVADGSDAYLLVGSMSACKEAAAVAARDALQVLGDARPVLALALADAAWQMLFESQPGAELSLLQEALGLHVPLVGGYTLGQIVPGKDAPPKFLNQHLLVVLFGETA
ncbi:MAG: hypothetical protein FJZ96_01615 [Chloroflexi bacterium]|nr:hypothetical protein [Chloroflexota bacterium]